MMRRLLVVAAVTAVFGGCDRCGAGAWNRANVGAFERYAGALQRAAGTGLKLEKCAMFGMSRAGYCLLRGPSPEVSKFVGAFSVTPDDPKERYYKDGCANLAAFGTPTPATASHVLRPGASLGRPAGPLPSNTDNVKLDAIAVDPSGERVCLEFQFPYG